MKTVQFFLELFKVYKLSFVVVILMIVLATLAQALFPVFSGQAVTQLANLVQAYQDGNPELVLAKFIRNHGQSWSAGFGSIYLQCHIHVSYDARDCRIDQRDAQRPIWEACTIEVSFFDRRQDGDILSRFTSDLDNHPPSL